jgi:septin family protein
VLPYTCFNFGALKPGKNKRFFNIMVCGASGLGKSNFIEFLLKQVDFEAASQLLKTEPQKGVTHSLGRLT